MEVIAILNLIPTIFASAITIITGIFLVKHREFIVDLLLDPKEIAAV